MDASDIDHNFEPQIRARSNTWPLRPNRVDLDPEPGTGSPASEDSNNALDAGMGLLGGQQVAGLGSPGGVVGRVMVGQDSLLGLGNAVGGGIPGVSVSPDGLSTVDPLGLTAKKSGSRRNAWGNLSYADLITKAIQSSPEKRLTLSQIYDWMVQNVPYFKDKGDSTSSAGWKNSIRHNLSLHSRFMRIQNEGTGKSSWWVINPDAKPGKAPRRRAGSMETKNYDKKRGRIRKKIAELRAGAENGGPPLGLSEDYLDTLSFGEFRQRTSSNASSCGRLSPIQAGMEPDLHDSQVPPVMSPIPWGSESEESGIGSMYGTGGDNFSELVDSLVGGMKLTGHDTIEMPNGLTSDAYLSRSNDYGQSPPGFLTVNDGMGGSDNGQYSHLPAPPPYPERPSPNTPSPQQSSQLSPLESGSLGRSGFAGMQGGMGGVGGGFSPVSDLYEPMGLDQLGSPAQQQGLVGVNTPERSQPNSPNPPPHNVGGGGGVFAPPQAPPPRLSPQTHRANPPGGVPQGMRSPVGCQLSPQQTRALLGSVAAAQQQQQQQQQQQALQQAVNMSILRNALTRSPLMYGQQQPTTTTTTAQFLGGLSPTSPTTSSSSNNLNLPTQQHQQQHLQQQQLQQQQPQQQMRISPSNSNCFLVGGDSGLVGGGGSTTASAGCGLMANNSVGVNGMSMNNNVPLDIDMESLMSMDYDMDSVIKQELSLEGNLDCNFDNVMGAPPATSVSSPATHNFVH